MHETFAQKLNNASGLKTVVAAWSVFGIVGLIMTQPTTGATTQPLGPAETVAKFRADCSTGDSHAVERGIAATNSEEAMLRPNLAGVCVMAGTYESAMTTQFGKAAAGKWGMTPAAGPGGETVTGEKATVRLPGKAGSGVALVRQEGQWKLTFAGVEAFLSARHVEPAVPTDEPLRRLTDVAEGMRQVIDAIGRGEYPTATAAADAAEKAWTDAARGAQHQ